MKSKSIMILMGVLILAWVFLFQGTQTASSSPLLRITFTPSPTVTQPVPTLPPPPIITNPPLIPVTGTDKSANVDWLIVGGVGLLVLGVVGLAWPQKRKS
jgi:hypothetical protein